MPFICAISASNNIVGNVSTHIPTKNVSNPIIPCICALIASNNIVSDVSTHIPTTN